MSDFEARITFNEVDNEAYLYLFGVDNGRHVAIVSDLKTESDDGPQDHSICILYSDRGVEGCEVREVRSVAEWHDHMRKIKAFLSEEVKNG